MTRRGSWLLKQKGKRIAVLLPDLRGGGAERVSLDLAKAFMHSGMAPEFVLMQARGEFLVEAEAAFSIHNLGCVRVRQVPLALADYLRNQRPDALLAAMWPLNVIAPLARKLSGHNCKVLVSEHCILSAQYRNWGVIHRAMMRQSMALGYRWADARVGVSSGVADDIAYLSGLPRDAFSVIHNPIPSRDTPSDDAIFEAQRLWDGPEGARIVSVGSIKQEKNHSLLLRAFAQIDHPNARLMLVGDGEGREALLSLATELGVSSRVIFAGFRPDPTPFYKTADLFVLSSDYEGFGNVIVEALSCGTPVVSTDCPSGPAEILENGRFGQLVPVGDADALAQAINGALGEAADRDNLKRRAADFAPEIAARKYLELLDLS